MSVLVTNSQPVESSFNAALHQEVLKDLRRAGHEIDDCDLYGEDFNPVLNRAERLGYHGVPSNRLPVQRYVDHRLWAEALVFCFATWCFGMPAMLKGFFDTMLMPSVAFNISGPHNVKPSLTHIKSISAVVTYGRPSWADLLRSGPPRKSITRCMKLLTGGRARTNYHAQHHMNVATPERLSAFKATVGRAMLSFA